MTIAAILQTKGNEVLTVDCATKVRDAVTLLAERKIGALPSAFGGTLRAGFSLEMGGGFDRRPDALGSALKQAGSLFLAVETRFGPLYLGAGATKNGEQTMYLFLGPVW